MVDDGDDGIRYPSDDEDDAAGAGLREEGPTGRAVFDPTPYMRQLRGRGGAPGLP